MPGAWGTYYTDKSAAKWHNGHASSHSLHEDILDRTEWESQVPRQDLEYAETHQASRHSHGAHPTRLQSKIHVGEANDQADQQADCNTTKGEAAAVDDRLSLGGILRVRSIWNWGVITAAAGIVNIAIGIVAVSPIRRHDQCRTL